MYDYKFTSPSLEGILTNAAITYEGITRPVEIFRVMDGPASKGQSKELSEGEFKVLEQYFHDLYGVLQKKLSAFALETSYSPSEGLKLQAMLQEMIKVRRLLGREIQA